jgi:hypothetical protein
MKPRVASPKVSTTPVLRNRGAGELVDRADDRHLRELGPRWWLFGLGRASRGVGETQLGPGCGLGGGRWIHVVDMRGARRGASGRLARRGAGGREHGQASGQLEVGEDPVDRLR